MSTINISLPQEQINVVDLFVKRYGFANRSEFVRSLIRLIKSKPEVVNEAAIYPFISPTTRSTKTILADFKKTNKYSSAFLKALEEGLKQSNYFKS